MASTRSIAAGTPRASRRPAQSPPEKKINDFRRELLAWYDQHARDLPWRRTRDPYAIWLSEIMLQQTRVAAVLEHYRIFLERFPDVQALAAASEDDVLAAWSGLGYYRRARMLHQCAREVAENRGGRFPQTAEELRTLPGIGRYTAAAIASIAFAEPVTVVDGNVERVLQRVTGKILSTARVWEEAQRRLSTNRPADFNQAMMELGATVCLPREPRCLICPVRKGCATQGEVPRTKITAPQQKKQIWCALQKRDGEVRLVRRAKKASLMAGMWELPQWVDLPQAVPSEAPWRTFRHSITVTDYTVHVFRDGRTKRAAKVPRGQWIPIEKILQLPITGLTRKILKADGVI